MTPDAALQNLLTETRAIVTSNGDLSSFAGTVLDNPAWVGCTPRDIPATVHLPQMLSLTSPATEALTFAVLAASPHLKWQQSYTSDQVGNHYLQNYGWFDLVSPDGPYLAEDCRVAFGFWNKGLVYPRHWHAPEEIYFVLAGEAVFQTDGREPVHATPGSMIHHPSNIGHAIDMTQSPLLVFAIWKGDGVTAVSNLESDP